MNMQPEIAALVGEIDFDPDALKSKYLHERYELFLHGRNQYIFKRKCKFKVIYYHC